MSKVGNVSLFIHACLTAVILLYCGFNPTVYEKLWVEVSLWTYLTLSLVFLVLVYTTTWFLAEEPNYKDEDKFDDT